MGRTLPLESERWEAIPQVCLKFQWSAMNLSSELKYFSDFTGHKDKVSLLWILSGKSIINIIMLYFQNLYIRRTHWYEHRPWIYSAFKKVEPGDPEDTARCICNVSPLQLHQLCHRAIAVKHFLHATKQPSRTTPHSPVTPLGERSPCLSTCSSAAVWAPASSPSSSRTSCTYRLYNQVRILWKLCKLINKYIF